MKIYHKTDIVWQIDRAIDEAKENNQIIALIELDVIETRSFLDDIPNLWEHKNVENRMGIYFYRGIELKFNFKGGI